MSESREAAQNFHATSETHPGTPSSAAAPSADPDTQCLDLVGIRGFSRSAHHTPRRSRRDPNVVAMEKSASLEAGKKKVRALAFLARRSGRRRVPFASASRSFPAEPSRSTRASKPSPRPLTPLPPPLARSWKSSGFARRR